MRSRPHPPSEAEDTSPGEDKAISDDNDLKNPKVRGKVETPYLKPIRIPPKTRAPPSPSLSISTTTSEFELEHGEELLRVKRARVKEEDTSDRFPSAEVISSDESEKPPVKKWRVRTTSKKAEGKRVKKPGMITYPDAVSTFG